MSNHAFDCAWLTSYQACTCGHDDEIRARMLASAAETSREWKQREADAIAFLRAWSKDCENSKGWSKIYDAWKLADAIGVVLMKLDAEKKP